jgi:intraflagellar transport protein 52
MENNLNILFNQSKDELFSLTSGYKKFQRELKNWKIVTNREEISLEKLAQSRIFVTVAPQKKFLSNEIEALKRYVNQHNGSLLILLSEGGEAKLNTNINFLLEEYGIFVNNDAIIRTTYFKYFNPKEALVSDGILNRSVGEAGGKVIDLYSVSTQNEKNEHAAQSLQFVYPFGATLNVQKPAVPILSSGTICYPIKRPLCALYGCNTSNNPAIKKPTQGKVCVVGSAHIFQDSYLDKEENRKILEVLIKYLTDDSLLLNPIDSEDPDVSEHNHIPNINRISDRVKTCLQDSEEIPRDLNKLFDDELFNMDTRHLPKIIKGFEELKIKHEPLPLISPQFETPLPPLKPAIFPPRFYEPEPPMLELFDLDEHFSSESARLAQITNKCSDDDLEFYIRECGEILGVTRHLQQSERDAKGILAYIASRVIEYRCLNVNV